jgi:hypothetical protein
VTIWSLFWLAPDEDWLAPDEKSVGIIAQLLPPPPSQKVTKFSDFYIFSDHLGTFLVGAR